MQLWGVLRGSVTRLLDSAGYLLLALYYNIPAQITSQLQLQLTSAAPSGPSPAADTVTALVYLALESVLGNCYYYQGQDSQAVGIVNDYMGISEKLGYTPLLLLYW